MLSKLSTPITVVSILIVGTVSAAAETTQERFVKSVRPVLKALCFGCHGANNPKAGIRLDTLNPDLIDGDDAETWHDALDQLNLGDMPPNKAKQPSAAQRRVLTEWMRAALKEAVEAARFKQGRVLMRRLTRYEYANTMRDLLDVDLNYARELPPEPASTDGFRNNGSTLEMSPAQIEMYLKVARASLREAIVSGEQPKLLTTHQEKTGVGRLPTRKVAGHEPVRPEFVLDINDFPRHGEFELKVTAQAALPNDEALPRMQLSMGHVPGIVHIPRKTIGGVDVSSESQTYTFRGRMEDFPQPGDLPFGNVAFKGMIVLIDFTDADGNELRYPDRQYAQPAPRAPKKKGNQQVKQPKPKPKPVPFGERLDIKISSVEFKAPVYASWPPPSHQRLLFDTENSNNESEYIRKLLKRFMTAAFRRPVGESEIERTASLFDQIRQRTDSFEDAVRETFASVLVSPHFLYIVETRDDPAKSQHVSDYELASRLSYFLGSTRPNERLLNLAESSKLHKPENLNQEVKRLLDDAQRSNEFLSRFVDQWLDLDALNRIAVNPEFFPSFDVQLKQHMRNETIAYVSEVLRRDLNALELLDSDWAMLNRPMAEHYGISGPKSSVFERVLLKDDDRRGGLLGQASFLLANSNGEDSHPIKRAVWILDRLLDSPPASPPPDVPDLDAESPDLAKLTLKEQLAVHREKASCANCHQGIDPWGVPLEHFDAIGRWRNEIPKHRKRPAKIVDASSTLPNGTKISGLFELKKYLVDQRRELFARSIVKRLMAFGLGRSLDFGDREAIEQLTSSFMENDFRLESLIVDFVQSESFQTK